MFYNWDWLRNHRSLLRSSAYIRGSHMCHEPKAVKMNKTEPLSSTISQAASSATWGLVGVVYKNGLIFLEQSFSDDDEFKKHLFTYCPLPALLFFLSAHLYVKYYFKCLSYLSFLFSPPPLQNINTMKAQIFICSLLF